jgi:predicted dehydrogenase
MWPPAAIKFLIVGLGSMGKRRIRCLQRLGLGDITGFDPRADRRDEARATYGIAVADDWDAAKAAPAEAWIIATPPDSHIAYGLQAIERGAAFFAEASVTDDRVGELIARLDASGLVGAPSCTMRYYPGPRRIKELINRHHIGRPLTFTYHCGQYLPDWHPWESYKDFYVSRRQTGACREIVPFELSWLTELFGPVASVSCMKGRLGDLDADIDDVYQLLLRFEANLIGHMLIDVLARPAVRLFRLVGTEGTIEWDQSLHQIRDYRAASGSWHMEPLIAKNVAPGYLHSDDPYVDEIADFVAAVRGKRPWAYSFADDERNLSLLRRAETSDKRGHHS